MQDFLHAYIHRNFPGFQNDIHLRFELGEPFENGTDQRICQVLYRVTTLFEDLFSQDDVIHLYIKDWGDAQDPMFGNTTPNYLMDLLSAHQIHETAICMQDEDGEEATYTGKACSGTVASFPYKAIFSGIANYEQGREPSIGQRVYFINMEKDIMFYMYDDRGCLVFAKDKERLRDVYARFNDWLVDYWRNSFDELFRED